MRFTQERRTQARIARIERYNEEKKLRKLECELAEIRADMHAAGKWPPEDEELAKRLEYLRMIHFYADVVANDARREAMAQFSDVLIGA